MRENRSHAKGKQATSGFSVKSKCISECTSGRDSANAIPPDEARSVLFRKMRMRLVLNVNAVRRVVIPSRFGPQHGLFERSKVSKVELYF